MLHSCAVKTETGEETETETGQEEFFRLQVKICRYGVILECERLVGSTPFYNPIISYDRSGLLVIKVSSV